MIPSTKNFAKLVNSKKSREGKKKKPSYEEEYKYMGEMPAIDTLSPVTKPKKAKK